MKKTVLAFLFLLNIVVPVFAQKYAEIIDSLEFYKKIQNYQKAINLINNYLQKSEDTTNPIVFIHLGYFDFYAAEKTKSCNKKEFYYKNSFLNLNKAKKIISDRKKISKKDLKKLYIFNDFVRFGDKADYNLILKIINKKMQDISSVLSLINTVCFYKNKAFLNYKKDRRVFFSLKQQYPTFTQLIFSPLENSSLLLDSVKIYYDSVVYYFQRYKIAFSNAFPDLKPTVLFPVKINTYLDIDTFSFRQDTFKIYNYKSWALKVEKISSQQIYPLKQRLVSAFEKIVRYIYLARKDSLWNLNPDTLFDKSLITDLEKNDKNSLSVKLLEYLTGSLKLSLLRNKILIRDSCIDHYFEFNDLCPVLKKNFKELDKAATPQNFAKYQSILKMFFGNFKDFKNFISQDTLKVINECKQIRQIFVKNIIEKYWFDDTLKNILAKDSVQKAFVINDTVFYFVKNKDKIYFKQKNDSIADYLKNLNIDTIPLFFNKKGNSVLIIYKKQNQTKILFRSGKFQKKLDTTANPVYAKILSDTSFVLFYLLGKKEFLDTLQILTQFIDNQLIDTIISNGIPVYFSSKDSLIFTVSALNSALGKTDFLSISKIQDNELFLLKNIPINGKILRTQKISADKFLILIGNKKKLNYLSQLKKILILKADIKNNEIKFCFSE